MYYLVDSLISLFAGVYVILAASGAVQVSRDPEKNEAWRLKYKKLLYIAGPVLIVYAIVRVLEYIL